MKTMGQCKTCIYWMQHKPELNGEIGTCQRYPPVIVGVASLQPETWKNTVCGEHVERVTPSKIKPMPKDYRLIV